MRQDSNNPPRDVDRVLHAEPVTIRLYGFKEISLPTYLMWYLTTILVVVVLVAGCNEIMTPQTTIGQQAHRTLAAEPWALDAIAWVPTFLLAGLVFEFFEGVFVLYAFRRRYRQIRGEYEYRTEC